ncbi:MAG: phosphate acyltransferase [Syntrophales bacterium]|nr:phosphate acyltransferase [Syntrophales bacterium]
MIRALKDFETEAGEKGPKKLAVLAPEDEEFMKAVKKSHELGYVEPILVGNERKIAIMAEKIGFSIDAFQKIHAEDPQNIADLGIEMLFSGAVPIAGKGQIPTSYIYRAIIRNEAKISSGMKVSVLTFWEIPGVDHLVIFTDTGVNIRPDLKTKVDLVKNAVFVYRLLGYPKPKIAVLSGQRPFVGGKLTSYIDAEELKKMATEGVFGPCEIIPVTSFTEIFMGSSQEHVDYSRINLNEIPHILLMPRLDTGNVICKLDFFLDVTRSSLVATSRGPVCIPSRADTADNIVQQLAMCVSLASRMEGEVG